MPETIFARALQTLIILGKMSYVMRVRLSLFCLAGWIEVVDRTDRNYFCESSSNFND